MGHLVDALFHFLEWVVLGAILVAAGGWLFGSMVWRSAAAGHRPASVEISFLKRRNRIVAVALIATVLGSIPVAIRQGRLGVEGLRLGLVLLGGLLLVVGGWRRGPAASSSRGRLASFMGAVGVFVILISAALSGHARGSALPVPNLMVALLHVTAAAAWVGGLVTLLIAAFPAVRQGEESERIGLLVPLIARFSDLAMWSVVAVVASGTYSAWMEIRGLRAVTASTYGLVFVAKLLAFLPVLALGGVNNRWTKPRIVRAVRDGTRAGASIQLLRRLVALEIILIAVVLALTVFLLQLSPPVLSSANG